LIRTARLYGGIELLVPRSFLAAEPLVSHQGLYTAFEVQSQLDAIFTFGIPDFDIPRDQYLIASNRICPVNSLAWESLFTF
jgi:hypothetical protein